MADSQNKKIFWIISHYAGGPSYCPRIPDYLIGKYMQEHGYKVIIFAASTVHNTEINFIEDNQLYIKKIVDGVPFVFVKTRSYENKKERVLNMLDFYFSVMKCYKHFRNPDLIMSAMPNPPACLAGYLIAKKLNIPYITSIVDLWPLSIVEYADVSERNLAIQLMYGFEKWLYEKSDELVFTWEGAYDYIVDKGWTKKIPRDKFHYINIGVELKKFYDNRDTYYIKDPDLEDDVFKVMYCGSVRTANDIGTVVSCAKILADEGLENKIRFIIYGDGPDKDILEERCRKENISNVKFKGFIDKKYIPYVLSRSNLNILNLKPSSTQKYGNSSNKLFEYLAAGNPVIANIDEGKYPIITKYGCGKVVKAESADQYAEGIKYFYEVKPDEYEKYRESALNTAKFFDTETLNKGWFELIEKRIELGRRNSGGATFRKI